MKVNSISPRVAERVMCITKCYKIKVVQVSTITTLYSEEDINTFYNDVGDTLGKLSHNTIVMGDFSAHIGKRTNKQTSSVCC